MRPDGTFLTTVQRAAQKEKNVQTDIHPFQIDIPQADLDDLQERLARTRWPDGLGSMIASKEGPDLGLRRRVAVEVAVRGPR
jgi:epoxide hydrolase-like protein